MSAASVARHGLSMHGSGEQGVVQDGSQLVRMCSPMTHQVSSNGSRAMSASSPTPVPPSPCFGLSGWSLSRISRCGRSVSPAGVSAYRAVAMTLSGCARLARCMTSAMSPNRFTQTDGMNRWTGPVESSVPFPSASKATFGSTSASPSWVVTSQGHAAWPSRGAGAEAVAQRTAKAALCHGVRWMVIPRLPDSLPGANEPAEGHVVEHCLRFPSERGGGIPRLDAKAAFGGSSALVTSRARRTNCSRGGRRSAAGVVGAGRSEGGIRRAAPPRPARRTATGAPERCARPAGRSPRP